MEEHTARACQPQRAGEMLRQSARSDVLKSGKIPDSSGTDDELSRGEVHDCKGRACPAQAFQATGSAQPDHVDIEAGEAGVPDHAERAGVSTGVGRTVGCREGELSIQSAVVVEEVVADFGVVSDVRALAG